MHAVDARAAPLHLPPLCRQWPQSAVQCDSADTTSSYDCPRLRSLLTAAVAQHAVMISERPPRRSQYAFRQRGQARSLQMHSYPEACFLHSSRQISRLRSYTPVAVGPPASIGHAGEHGCCSVPQHPAMAALDHPWCAAAAGLHERSARENLLGCSSEYFSASRMCPAVVSKASQDAADSLMTLCSTFHTGMPHLSPSL